MEESDRSEVRFTLDTSGPSAHAHRSRSWSQYSGGFAYGLET